MDGLAVSLVVIGLLTMMVGIVFGFLAARSRGRARYSAEPGKRKDWRYTMLAVILLMIGAAMVLFARF